MSSSSQDRIDALNRLQNFIHSEFLSEQAIEERPLRHKGYLLNTVVSKKLYFQYADKPDNISSYQRSPKSSLRSRVRMLIRNILTMIRPNADRSFLDKAVIGFTSEKKHLTFLKGIYPDLGMIDLSVMHAFSRKAWINPYDATPELIADHGELVILSEGIETMLKQSKIKQIFLVEGNSVYDNLLSIIARSIGIKTICLQYGWAFTPHLGFQQMAHSEYWSWGPAFSDVLKAWNPGLKFKDIGHQLLPERLSKPREPQAISVFFQAPVRWMGEDTFDAFVQACLKLAEYGYQLLLRPHPSWPLKDEIISAFNTYEHVEWIDPQKVPLQDQMERSGIALTVFSSVGFEAIAFERIPIFYQPGMNIVMEPQVDDLTFPLIYSNQDQLIKWIEKLMDPMLLEQSTDELQVLKGQLFAPPVKLYTKGQE